MTVITGSPTNGNRGIIMREDGRGTPEGTKLKYKFR